MKIKLSASSLEKWSQQCQVRWAFEKIAGFKEPFAKAAQAGVEVHKRLEDNNIVPGERWDKYPVGDMAAALHAHTPPGVIAHEQRFDVELDGVPFHGVMDLRGADFVADYKTTSKKTYIKSAKALETNIQRLLYTEVAQDVQRTTWIYGVWTELEGCKSWNEYSPTIRTANIDRSKDRERFKLHVLKPAEEILALSEGTDPLSLVKNKASCGLFPPAGCPHKNRCFPPVTQVSMSQKKSSLFNTLMKDEPAGESAADLPVAVPAAVATPTAEAASDVGTQYAVEILFVDCFPLSQLDEPLVFSHSLISRASATVADDLGVIHVRVPKYNEGMDRLAVQVMHDVMNKPIKYLQLETKSKEGQACMQPLMGLARMVVKGTF